MRVFLDDENDVPQIEVRIPGALQPEKFHIDTGYYCGVGNLRTGLFGRLIMSGNMHPAKKTEQFSIDQQGFQKAGWLTSLKLVGIEHRNLFFVCSARENVLGLGFLKRHIVTLDFPASRIYLKKGRKFYEPNKTDRSGLKLHRLSEETIVRRVQPKSAAELAGIKAGDVVVSIGDLSANRVRMMTLVQRLCDADKTVPITLRRKGSQYSVSLKLE